MIGTPVYSLSYKSNNVPVTNLPLKLPIMLLKLCIPPPVEAINAQTFVYKWNFECESKCEVKQQFNIDFN